MRKLFITVAVIALIAAAAWYWTRPQPVLVTIETVALGNVEATVANTRAGTIKACQRAKLSPPAGGQVSILPVREGDRVEAGDVLLELWNEDLRAQVRLAENQRTAANAHRQQVCLNADMAQRETERLAPLRAKNLISAEKADKTATEAHVAAAACRAAEANAKVSDGQVAVARAALARTILRAPFTGIVAELNGEIGEIVTPSSPGIPTPPAVDLIDCSCVYVSAPIDEVDAPDIRIGMRTRISMDAFPDAAQIGLVRRKSPYVLDIEKQARTVDVEVNFDEPDRCANLLPGYSADIEIILDVVESVLRIPSQAVLEGNRVMVLDEEDIIVERRIETGLSNWSYTQVVSGLQAGERIITSFGRPGVEPGTLAAVDE